MAASEVDGCTGVGDALGRLVGRARAGKLERVGRPAWAEQAEAACEAYILSLFFLFCFSFRLLCLNSNLVLELEFQLGAPNLLEF